MKMRALVLRHALLAAAMLSSAVPAMAKTVLFVGNSFTFGAHSPAWKYRAGTVSDLNGGGVGGVPALFKLFADQMKLDYDVSLETSPGKSLEWHWTHKRSLIDRRWDHVVLQDYSTLDADNPGDAAKLIDYSGRLAAMVAQRNPDVDVSVMATWSRPDQTYVAGKRWSGQAIYAMALDLRRAYDRAAAHADIDRVDPVGQAFNCAIAMGVADPNPYDGIAFGQIDLWTHDHYHASAAGYYLTALSVFVGITGQDVRTLGKDERGARELGLAPDVAVRLQDAAWRTSRGEPCKG